jgi:hypothetical protein
MKSEEEDTMVVKCEQCKNTYRVTELDPEDIPLAPGVSITNGDPDADGWCQLVIICDKCRH